MFVRDSEKVHAWTIVVAALAAVWWSWIGAQTLWVAAGNARILGAFFTDEVLQVDLVRSAIDRGGWNLHFGSYGHLVFNSALVLLKLVGSERPGDQEVAVVLRGLSLFWAWATTCVTFVLARRMAGVAAGLAAATLLALHPVQLRWATLAHPDTAQTCLIVMTVLALASFERQPRTRMLVVSAIMAGLAFATKYLSITLVPLYLLVLFRHGGDDALRARSAFNWRLVWLTRALLGTGGAVALFTGVFFDPIQIAAAVAEDGHVDFPGGERLSSILDWLLIVVGVSLGTFILWSNPWRRLVLNSQASTIARWTLIGSAVFIAAFLVVSPLSMYHLFIVKGMVLVFGALLFGDGTPWTALVIEAVGLAVVPLAIGLTLGVRTAWKSPIEDAPELGLSALWFGLCSLVLLLIRWPAEQYLLPLYPFGAALVVVGIDRVVRTVASWQQRIDGRWLVGAAYAGALAVAVVPFPATMHQWVNRIENNPAIPLGRSMEARFSETATVLYDQSTYVPTAFAHVTATWGGTRQLLDMVSPDVVVVRHRPKAEMTDEVREYYECLVAESCGYKVALSNEFASVLERDGQ